MEKNYFFFLALPRSGTAWLANLFSNGESFCFHEGIWRFKGAYGMKEKMDAISYLSVGNSDCSNIFCLPLIESIFQPSRAVVIRQDPAVVIKELQELNILDDNIEIVDNTYEYLVRLNKGVFVVEFKDIFSFEVADEIRKYCRIQSPLDKDRFDMLKELSVTLRNDKILLMRQNNQSIVSSLDTETMNAFIASIEYFKQGGD